MIELLIILYILAAVNTFIFFTQDSMPNGSKLLLSILWPTVGTFNILILCINCIDWCYATKQE